MPFHKHNYSLFGRKTRPVCNRCSQYILFCVLYCKLSCTVFPLLDERINITQLLWFIYPCFLAFHDLFGACTYNLSNFIPTYFLCQIWKIAAMNLIAAERVTEGVDLLVMIGHIRDACKYVGSLIVTCCQQFSLIAKHRLLFRWNTTYLYVATPCIYNVT